MNLLTLESVDNIDFVRYISRLYFRMVDQVEDNLLKYEKWIHQMSKSLVDHSDTED